MNINKFNALFDFVDHFCDNSLLFWSIFRHEYYEKTRNEITDEFYTLSCDFDLYEEYDMDVFKDNSTYQTIIDIIDAINTGYYVATDADEFLNEVILKNYERNSDNPVKDFFNDYGGLTRDQILEEYVKNESTVYYDEVLEIVVEV